MVNVYVEEKEIKNLPRLPLEGNIDLTYRCNNNCRHCWLRIPQDASKAKDEFSFEEIKNIVEEAKKMGCRRWNISGGEPMLRPDFYEIFDYITSNSSPYSINTNGTLITPKIAQLMKRKGIKMVVLYGATAEVHDYITRQPGSFEAVMRGFAYLEEAGAGFIVQLIPLRDNYHQFKEMVKLAESLSKDYRIGASWLYLSACGDIEKNKEIIQQRISPEELAKLDKPDLFYEEWMKNEFGQNYCSPRDEKYFFNSCITKRQDFYIDPYGKMSFCSFIKEPGLCYDLRTGSFQDAWEKFIPSLKDKVMADVEYRKNCGSCQLRQDCYWCPAYAYLEHHRFSAKIDYLCAVAKENKKFKEDRLRNYRRYYRIADITIQLDSDLPISKNTFHPKFKKFEVDGLNKDNIFIRHHFSLPDLDDKDLGKEVYRNPPWAIYKKQDSWIYLGISPVLENNHLHKVAIFNHDYSRAHIYSPREDIFLRGNLPSLTSFPTDQLLLARVLADRQGCYLHSCGIIFEGEGFLFVGHSEAGKSTMATLLKDKAEILCDDRIIVRSSHGGFKIYGTWSHGDVPDVSPNCAPLKAIFFLEKSQKNKSVLLFDKKEVARRLLAYVIRPFETMDWWQKTILVIDKIADEVPCYTLQFDKNGGAIDILRQLLQEVQYAQKKMG